MVCRNWLSKLINRKTNKAIAFFAVALFLSSCSEDTNKKNGKTPTEFDRKALIKHIGQEIILPSYRQWKTDIDQLEKQITTFTQAADVNTLQATKKALRVAYLSWQTCSFFEFGPAEKVILRGLVNTYPTQRDNINANIKSGSYNLATVSNISSVGLPALDYLLNGIADSPEAIAKLYQNEGDTNGNRRKYLNDVIEILKNKAKEVQEAWKATNGNYLKTFTGSIGTEVGSPLGLLVNAYIKHYERFSRDGKIGIPTGMRSAGIARPLAAEAYYGGYSLALAIQNIKALQGLYLGTAKSSSQAAVGLDDLLISLDKKELNDKISAQFETILNKATALKDPFTQQIKTDPAPAQALYKELQKLLVLLKVDMASAIGVIITYQDNDGD